MQQLPIKNIQRGFSAIELMGALMVFAFIFLVVNERLNTITQVKLHNQLIDQSKAYTKMATQYLTDNYRSLLMQTKVAEVVIPFSAITQYIPSGVSTLTMYSQTPCIYVAAGSSDAINAYLIFGNRDKKAKSLTRVEAGEIARALGGSAGVLVDAGNGKYTIYASTAENLSISASSQDKIRQTCGLVTLANNSLIINLSQDKSFFAAIKGSIDQAATANDTDPSLKKFGNLTTMQSNLYLDNVLKESSNYTKYYCDATKLLVSDANSVCSNYANANKLSIYSDSSTWISSILSTNQQACSATANAHFYTTTTNYTCSNVVFPPASNYCPATSSAKTLVPGSGVWSPLPGILSGSQCFSNASASYQTPAQCSWSCTNKSSAQPWLASDCPSLEAICKKAMLGYFLLLGNYTGVYDSATRQCITTVQCSQVVFKNPYPFSGSVAPSSQSVTSQISCGQVAQNANSSQIINDLGFRNCASPISFASLLSTIGVPAEHVYRAIDYGVNLINGQRIQIRSNAAAGATSGTSQLNINNAGLQAGYIAPQSNPVAIGTSCSAVELGKMTQQLSSQIIVVGGQLQCTYNPTYCPSGGYCYLPIKSSSFIYKFATLKNSYSCPTGTIVDDVQPSAGINASIACPDLSGWTISQGVHGVRGNCYDGVAGFSFCTTYQTQCSYTNSSGLTQDHAVTALAQLKCGVSNNTFTLENYTQ